MVPVNATVPTINGTRSITAAKVKTVLGQCVHDARVTKVRAVRIWPQRRKVRAKRKKVCSAARVSSLRWAGEVLAIEAWRANATPRPGKRRFVRLWHVRNRCHRGQEGLTETTNGDDENGVSAVLAIPPADRDDGHKGQHGQNCRAGECHQLSVRQARWTQRRLTERGPSGSSRFRRQGARAIP